MSYALFMVLKAELEERGEEIAGLGSEARRIKRGPTKTKRK